MTSGSDASPSPPTASAGDLDVAHAPGPDRAAVSIAHAPSSSTRARTGSAASASAQRGAHRSRRSVGGRRPEVAASGRLVVALRCRRRRRCRGGVAGPAMRGCGPVVRPSAAAAPPSTSGRSAPLPPAARSWSGRSKILSSAPLSGSGAARSRPAAPRWSSRTGSGCRGRVAAGAAGPAVGSPSRCSAGAGAGAGGAGQARRRGRSGSPSPAASGSPRPRWAAVGVARAAGRPRVGAGSVAPPGATGSVTPLASRPQSVADLRPSIRPCGTRARLSFPSTTTTLPRRGGVVASRPRPHPAARRRSICYGIVMGERWAGQGVVVVDSPCRWSRCDVILELVARPEPQLAVRALVHVGHAVQCRAATFPAVANQAAKPKGDVVDGHL